MALAPLAGVASVLVAFGEDPVGFIVEVVAAFLVATLLELGGIAVGAVDTIASTVAAVPRFVRLLVSGAFSQAGALVIGGIADLFRGVATTAQAAGPAGPVLVTVTLALTLVALYRVSVALIGEVPGGSSLVDIFNLR
jgi:hypothetical protein